MPPTSQQLLDALPFDGYAVDGRGTVVAVVGAAAATAVGRTVWDALDGHPSREQAERALDLLRTGRTPAVRWEVPRGSGDDGRTVLVQATPLRSTDAADRYLFSAVDITPSHRSREALIDAGISLSRTIALDRVFAEGGQQLRRTFECEAFCIAVADDAAALRVEAAGGYDESAAELEMRLAPVWADALASGRVVVQHGPLGPEVTAPMSSADGVVGAITVLANSVESAARLDEADRVLATLAAQTSAAIERAWLVRRVEHKRRLEAIGEVAAGVAHELRNPLSGISSAAQLLRFRVREDPVIERNVGRILREVERLNRMVTALLEYGRPDAVHLAPGDPDAVWDDVLEAQRGLLESRALVIHRTRAEHRVRCAIDAEQLGQLFVNLLVNAADAAPEASDLTLASFALPGGGWKCRLHNGGPAIPPEALARAFEIFFSSKPGGTRIGLALCQRIVDEHGGTIAIESASEKGTAVTVMLPGV
jgi:signal transduction histidine kinase